MTVSTSELTGDPVHSMSYRAGYLESTLDEIRENLNEAL